MTLSITSQLIQLLPEVIHNNYAKFHLLVVRLYVLVSVPSIVSLREKWKEAITSAASEETSLPVTCT